MRYPGRPDRSTLLRRFTRLPFLALALFVTPGLSAQAPPKPTNAEVREAVTQWNDEWAKARLATDTATFQRMLPAAYVAIMNGDTMSRQQFLAGISAPPAGLKLARFDVKVLTVAETPTGWAAVIEEKLEIDRTGADGKTTRTYHVWVIRDLWKQVDGRWMLESGEVIGTEGWRGGARPPFRDW